MLLWCVNPGLQLSTHTATHSSPASGMGENRKRKSDKTSGLRQVQVNKRKRKEKISDMKAITPTSTCIQMPSKLPSDYDLGKQSCHCFLLLNMMLHGLKHPFCDFGSVFPAVAPSKPHPTHYRGRV